MKSLKMKKLAIYTIAAAAMLGATTAEAATAAGTFDVTINLATTCTVDTTTLAPTIDYVADAATATYGGGTGFSVTCTNGVGYGLSLDTGGANYVSTTFPDYNYTDSTTGLNYTLGLPAGSGALTGSGGVQNHTLSATLTTLPQTGTCTTATCQGINTHTLTVTY